MTAPLLRGCTALLALSLSAAGAGPALSVGTDSGGGSGAQQCSKYPKGSKDWKTCMGQWWRQDAEDAYALGYWLAKTGEYREALDVLSAAADPSDPRVLTMTGFVLRKLGDMDKALGFYSRALAANPDLTTARQYLGEAYLDRREPAKAREQLAEIGKRCGAGCEEYLALAGAIAGFERAGS